MADEEGVQLDAGADAGADAPAPVGDAPSTTDSGTSGGVPEEYQDRFTEAGWKEYTDLRHENAGYRQRWSPYEEAFGALPQDLSEGFRTLASYMGHDPYGAAQMMGELYDAYASAVGYDPASRYAQEPVQYDYDGQYYTDPMQEPMTRGEYAAAMAQLQNQQYTEQTQAQIVDHARSLGFDPQTDPEGYERLILRALHSTGSDLDAAAAALRAEQDQARQQWQRDFLASKQRDAAGTLVAPSDGGQPTGARPIHNLKDSFEAAAARIAAVNEVPAL